MHAIFMSMKETPKGMNRREFIAGAAAAMSVAKTTEAEARQHPLNEEEAELIEDGKKFEAVDAERVFKQATEKIEIITPGVTVTFKQYQEFLSKDGKPFITFTLTFSFPARNHFDAMSLDLGLPVWVYDNESTMAEDLRQLIINNLESRSVDIKVYP